MNYYLKQIKGIRDILPVLMVVLTKHDRMRVDIEWSSKSWVHNIFRFYELLFWRRVGIRPELSSSIDTFGNTCYYYHSFESMCALFEQKVREALKFRLKLPYKIVFPQLAMPGLQSNMSPYLFAIAFDATSSAAVDSGTSGQTWAHTITGSNMMLFTGTFARASEHTVTAVSYNGSASTAIDSQQGYLNTDTIYTYYKLAPTTGTNNIATTYNASGFGGSVAASYSGVKQSGQPDASFKHEGDGSSNNFDLTVTTVADNCWIVGVWQPADGTCSAGSNTTMRVADNDQIGDGGPFTPAGSNTIHMVSCGNRVQSKLATSFSPATAAGPANLKTYNTNPTANVKTINTNPIANVKTLDTNA